MESTKHEILNSKWFDRFTVLSNVAGQIQMTEVQMIQTMRFEH